MYSLRLLYSLIFAFPLVYVHAEGVAREIHVLWLAPREDQEDFTLASSMGPFALAVEESQTDRLLHNYTVNITWGDSACQPKAASGNFVRYFLSTRPDVIFGPPCTKAMVPVADLAAFFDIPVYSWVSHMHELDNKTEKSTLMRAIAPLSSLGDLLIFFCERMRWFHLSMIATVGELTEGMASFFKQTLEANDNFYLTRLHAGVKEGANRTQIEKIYNVIKTESRIIILVVPRDEVRKYLIVADDMGMTNGEYQFLYTERTVADKEFLASLTSPSFWQKGDEEDDKARRGYHNLLYFTYHYVTEWHIDTEAATAAARRVFAKDPTMPNATAPDKFSRFLYDAFYLYAIAVNETLTKGLPLTGANIFNASKNKIFSGMTGRFLTNDNADRQSSFLIWDMNKSNIFHQVVITRYALNGEKTWELINPIRWGNGKSFNGSDNYIPPDKPPCGFQNEYCLQDNIVELVAPPIVVTLMLAGFIAFLVIYRWWKKERELYETLWKVKYSELNFNISRGPISQAAVSNLGSRQSLNDCSDNRSDTSTGNTSSYSNCRHDNMVMISQMFTQVAKLNGDQVAVRKVRKKSIREDKLLLKEMKIMKSLKHTNLATFHGACTESPNICVLWEYCSKGSLEDILHNQDIKLESMFQFSIALDICTGLNYLHTSELGVHGRLKTSNCVVDSRWVAKLTDFGLKRFKKGEKPADDTSTDKYYTDLLWTAPEVLRSLLNNEKVTSTKEADVYSLGIVLKQLLCKNFAYSEELQYMSAKDIIMRIAQVEPEHIQMRPHIIEEFPEHQVVMMSFVKLIKSCWSEDPTHRPTIKQVLRNMKRMSPLKMTGVLDNMLALMERYSTRLEDLVSERTLQLEEEKRKTDTLLYRMLPRKVADDLKAGQHVQAEAFQDVTIYFSDIVGFTTLAGESTPMEIVEMLNLLYSQFDNIIQNFNVYKVETIGDAYMVVCGCPEPNPDHAPVMADMSLALLDSVIHFVIPHRPQNQLRIRIGLNSGPVVAGVVGNTMPRYCLFGNTVNLASRMESQGMPLRIQLSYFTYEILKNDPDFIMVPRGLVEIKGKGMMPTYWLKGRRSTMEVHLETDKLARSANSVQANAFTNKEAIEKKAPEITNQQTTVDPQLTSDITLSPTSNKDVDPTKHTCDLMYSRFPGGIKDELDTINCAQDQCWDDHFRNLSSKTDKPFQNNSSGQTELNARPDSYLASDSVDNGNYAGDNFGRSFSDRSFGSNESFHTLVLSKQNGFTIFKDALQYVPSSVSECELNSVSKHVSGQVPANVVSDQGTKKENSGNSGQRISVTTSLNSLATPSHKVKIATLPAIIPTPHNATEKEGSPFSVKSTLKNKAKSHSKVPAFGASENGFMDEKGKDYSHPRSKSFTDSLAQYSSDEDTSDRTAVIYSARPSPSKKSPIKYHPGKDPSLKKSHSSRADGTNGVTIYDEDESDPSEKISFIEKHKSPAQNDAKNIVSMQKLKKDMFSKHTPNAHNRHSPTKKPAEKYSLQPIEKLRLLNSPSWNEKGQLNTKAFDVHLDVNKKSKNYQKKVTSQHGKSQSADGNLREKVIDSNHLELCDKSFEI